MYDHVCTHAADKGFFFYEQRTSLCLVLPTHFRENLLEFQQHEIYLQKVVTYYAKKATTMRYFYDFLGY